jgi:hypothetical protein
MNINSFEMAVAIPSRNGLTKIKEYGHGGLTYVESRDGQEFAIIFRNNSASRILAVPSVDGLCTLDGQPATAQSRGYVVPAYSSVEVKGWRTSLDDISAFVFNKKEGSYSEATGNGTQNCGVIAVKVFQEKPTLANVWSSLPPKTVHHHHHHYDWNDYFRPSHPYRPWPEIWCGGFAHDYNGPIDMTHGSLGGDMLKCCVDNSSSVGGPVYSASLNMAAETPDFDMGTGFGQHQKDTVSETSFERGTELATLTIYYASAEKLKSAGVQLEKIAAVSKPLPQAFSAGFCKAPASKS